MKPFLLQHVKKEENGTLTDISHIDNSFSSLLQILFLCATN